MSSRSQNTSLFSKIHNLTSCNRHSNSKFIDQATTEAESDNHFQHDHLSSIDDNLNRFANMIDRCPLSTDESGEFVLKILVFNLNNTWVYNF